jgi:hypothetical protein
MPVKRLERLQPPEYSERSFTLKFEPPPGLERSAAMEQLERLEPLVVLAIVTLNFELLLFCAPAPLSDSISIKMLSIFSCRNFLLRLTDYHGQLGNRRRLKHRS